LNKPKYGSSQHQSLKNNTAKLMNTHKKSRIFKKIHGNEVKNKSTTEDTTLTGTELDTLKQHFELFWIFRDF
jgi:hypothetical protein